MTGDRCPTTSSDGRFQCPYKLKTDGQIVCDNCRSWISRWADEVAYSGERWKNYRDRARLMVARSEVLSGKARWRGKHREDSPKRKGPKKRGTGGKAKLARAVA